MDHHFNNLFVPGCLLILDESLVHTYGKINFKVRIMTKLAPYGIKVYVVTDVETYYVIKFIVFQGMIQYIFQPLIQKIKKKYGWLNTFVDH